MPTSVPEIYPALIVEPVPAFRLPPGTWLLVAWAVVMLVVGFAAPATTGAIDQFQLLANF
jgi:hypothetical protein